MSSQESDLYPDEGDDLVMAFLEQEAEVEAQCQGQDQAKRGSQSGKTMKRARTRSASPEPDMINPHTMGLKVEGKVDTEAPDSRSKKRRMERSPSIEVLEVRTTSTSTRKSKAQIKEKEKKPTIKREQPPPSSSHPSSSSSSSAPIIILEPPIAWPPGKMTSAEGIKQAHTVHRKYLAASSSSGPSPSSVVSSSSCLAAVPTGMKKSMGDPSSTWISRTRTQIKHEQPPQSQNYQYQPTMVKIHPSMTGESSQTTLTPQLDEFDEDENNPSAIHKPLNRSKSKSKVKKEEQEEDFVVTRDSKGNLTEKARRALDKKLLESLGREENAITNSDLYSRTQHIISAASGHQVSNRGGAKYSISGKDYNTSRNQKLKQQFTAAVVKPGDDTGAGSENAVGADSGGKAVKETFVVQSRIFDGLTMWLNGYSGNKITDMELKKLIAVHGGTISMNEGSRITHVLVSERISGTKAEKFLKGATKAYTKNGKKKVVLVDCESGRSYCCFAFFGYNSFLVHYADAMYGKRFAGVLDSVKQGRRLGESAYNVIENEVSAVVQR
ncbi:hypothetical protein FFLO_05409 [Filobasidium floriforme]|uniref:BRCT domain-containing protein n=1 Tax=Filobasidium floriforme TaxID=5210 RepID=A0A8K0JH07_9TREE|nr:uncharacterized protein HD553DRAFT_135138 [Filobasidium floriforme]KAG7529769.1 hypothetical protein FFLO_05409 [Filobasidium floriforme]KAH8079344.1 hypothetical protein HD553DRAFT_135138 [Filobasidium floriforme]